MELAWEDDARDVRPHFHATVLGMRRALHTCGRMRQWRLLNLLGTPGSPPPRQGMLIPILEVSPINDVPRTSQPDPLASGAAKILQKRFNHACGSVLPHSSTALALRRTFRHLTRVQVVAEGSLLRYFAHPTSFAVPCSLSRRRTDARL